MVEFKNMTVTELPNLIAIGKVQLAAQRLPSAANLQDGIIAWAQSGGGIVA